MDRIDASLCRCNVGILCCASSAAIGICALSLLLLG
jgi:hypothetical protein